MNVLFVEPNIHIHPDFELTTMASASEKADLVVYLVKHKVFMGLKASRGAVLDFCGIGD